MRILDIDMDYFLKDIPSECPNGRLEEEYIETWKEQEYQKVAVNHSILL